MGNHIFISYSSHDATLAFKIVEYLESHGHPCWIAPRDIGSGMDYTDVINNAIENCSALVLLFSSRSVQSQFVKKELTTAVSFNKTILPFKISNVELKGGYLFLLNNVQWIDATSHPESKFQLIIDGLNGQNDTIPPIVSSIKKKQGKGWIFVSISVLLVLVFLLWFLFPKNDIVTDNQTDSDTIRTSIIEETTQPNNPTVENASQPPSEIKTMTKEQKEKKVTTKTPQHETVSEAKPTGQTDSTHTKTITEKKNSESHADKMYKVNSYYNKGKYQAALKLLEEMKKENPSDGQLDDLINKCREKL